MSGVAPRNPVGPGGGDLQLVAIASASSSSSAATNAAVPSRCRVPEERAAAEGG